MLNFERVHHGYLAATSEVTGNSYVVRTRPKDGGWMAIDDTYGYVIATGLHLAEAERVCERIDQQVREEMFA